MADQSGSEEALRKKRSFLESENIRLQKIYEEDLKALGLLRDEVVEQALYLQELLCRRNIVKELIIAKGREGKSKILD